MRLDKPFYAVINPDNTEIVWDWETPLQGQTKREAKEAVAMQIKLAEQPGNASNTSCGHTAAWWRRCTIQKVVLSAVVPHVSPEELREIQKRRPWVPRHDVGRVV